jgi:hypothetical protein
MLLHENFASGRDMKRQTLDWKNNPKIYYDIIDPLTSLLMRIYR